MKTLQKILMPVDFSNATQNAVRHANSILEKHNAEVVMVYVNTPDNKLQEQDIQNIFKTFEENILKEFSYYYRLEVLHGNLLKELANATLKHKADLVIMGLRERIPDIALASELMRTRKKSNALVAVY